MINTGSICRKGNRLSRGEIQATMRTMRSVFVELTHTHYVSLLRYAAQMSAQQVTSGCAIHLPAARAAMHVRAHVGKGWEDGKGKGKDWGRGKGS